MLLFVDSSLDKKACASRSSAFVMNEDSASYEGIGQRSRLKVHSIGKKVQDYH